MTSVPSGSEFQINFLTSGNQTNPAIAINATGQTIVVWEDLSDRDGDSSGIYARLYDVGGNPITGDFKVNTFTNGSQNTPAVAIDASGNFVVTWTSFGQIGISPEFTEIYAQRFISNGTAIGSEFLVNTTTNSFQSNSAVAVDGSGNYTVAWESLDQDGDGYGTYIRRFSASGSPLSGELLVNTTTTGDQNAPDIAANTTGNSVVVWQGAGVGDGNGIFAQLYSSAGVPQGGEILVNTVTSGIQGGASVAIDSAGNFIVVWTDQNGVDGGDIRAQRFNSTGVKIGSEFVVNTTLAGLQAEPDVTIDNTGNFTITWTGQDASGTGVFARQYNSAGVALGNEFLVNTIIANAQGVPAIASGNSGHLTIAYASGEALASSLNILAQRYSPPPTVQFSQAIYQVGESGLPVGVQLTLSRSGTMSGVTSQVQLAITGGTAQGGAASGGGNDYNNTGFPRTITFAAGQTTQTITVPIFQDLTIESLEIINLQISSPSNATIGSQSTAALQILDDDTQYAIAAGNANVTEGNSGTSPITFTITRTGTTAPTSIDFSLAGTATSGTDYSLSSVSGTGITIAGNTVNFAVGATTATLNFSVTGNQVDESDRTVQVNLSNPSPSGIITTASASTTIVDDDVAGITVVQSGGSTNVTEGGADTYTIALDSVPTSAVAVTITPTAQLDLGNGAGVPIVLSFASDATALIAQTIAVTTAENILTEGNRTGTIAYLVSSSDSSYSGQSIPNTVVNIADNDIGYTLAATATAIVEGNTGTTPLTFTMTRSGAIDSASAVDLDFAGTATNGADYLLSGAAGTGVTLTGNTINFAANAATATITLDVAGDRTAEADETVQLSLINATASGTATISGSPAAATITNDDTAGVIVTQTGGRTDVAEGGVADSYTIALTSVPAAPVTITLTPDAQIDLGNGAGVALVITFAADATALNPQTVVVNGIDDAIAEGNQIGTITQIISSADSNYSGLTLADIPVNITDNDISYAIAANTSTVTEGNTGNTSIPLTITRTGAINTASTVDLALTGTAALATDFTFASATGTGISIAGNTVTFAPGATTATVTLNVLGDEIAEANETIQVGLANAIASGTATVTGINPAVITINNDDTPGITVTQGGSGTLFTEEGTAETYTIALNTSPTVPVTVTITPAVQLNLGNGAGNPIALTFAADATALNPQTITVTAVDDALINGDRAVSVTHTISSGDSNYSGLTIPDVSVRLADNDIGYTITAATASLPEGNTGTTPLAFTVTRAGVTNVSSRVNFALGGTASNGIDYTLAGVSGTGVSNTGNTINFAANATTATITLNAISDRTQEPDKTVIASLTDPTAPGTATLIQNAATTTIANDDTAGVIITPSGGDTVLTEGGATDTYQIALATVPTGAVALTIQADAQSEISLDGINFAPTQILARTDTSSVSVTVRAVDDRLIEGRHSTTVTHTITGTVTDPNYPTSLAIAPLTATIADDDRSQNNPGVTGLNLIGTIRGEVLRGSQRSDVIQGRGGSDRLFGDGSDDRILGGSGRDWLWGEMGDDLLIGGSQQDRLDGGDGNDILDGGASRDRLNGGKGNDVLRGRKGADILIGGDGNDVLVGGNLNDLMTGGAGADRFVLQKLSEAGDRITDFNAQQDVIDLRQLFQQFSHRKSSLSDPKLAFVQNGSSTEVHISQDRTIGIPTLKTLVVLENINVADLNSRNVLAD